MLCGCAEDELVARLSSTSSLLPMASVRRRHSEHELDGEGEISDSLLSVSASRIPGQRGGGRSAYP